MRAGADLNSELGLVQRIGGNDSVTWRDKVAQTSVGLKPDRFVSELVQDPRKPPATIMVMAFIGKSPKEGCVRLYLDAQLAVFLDVPTESVLHARKVPQTVCALGGSYVWIDRESEMANTIKQEYQRMTEIQRQA
jgi:hypothetical protein